MKTKREMLEKCVEWNCCMGFQCGDCPYSHQNNNNKFKCLNGRLAKIGAMAILRQNRKKEESKVFDKFKILTFVDINVVKVGMRGYFGNTIDEIKTEFYKNNLKCLTYVNDEDIETVFYTSEDSYTFFYPIDEEVKNENNN